MTSRRAATCLLLLATGTVAAAIAQQPAGAPDPTAAQIVEKNALARGGVQAWSKIQTMVWTGRAETENAPGRVMPFLLEQKRPGNVRFELVVDGKKSVRIYDGMNGWKLRADRAGRPELLPYTADELRHARGAQVIEGPLMDYAAKGAAITLGGVGAVDGSEAYVLEVRLPSGGLHRVWVDAQTFLEVRHDREYRNAAGQPAMATVLYRDYRTFEGLQMPVVIETGIGVGKPTNRLIIERVALNPELDDGMFAKPAVPVPRRAGAALVDTRSAAPVSQPRASP